MVLLILLCIIKSTTIIPVPPRNKGGWRCNLCLHLVQPPSHSTGTWCCQFDLHGSGRIAFLLFFFHCSSLWDSAHLDWQPVAVGWFLQHTSTWVLHVVKFVNYLNLFWLAAGLKEEDIGQEQLMLPWSRWSPGGIILVLIIIIILIIIMMVTWRHPSVVSFLPQQE